MNKNLSSLDLSMLQRQDALLCLDILGFATEKLGVVLEGKTLLLAVSGGSDSTALLLIFCALRGLMHLNLHAAHLNHGIRQESALEAEFVQNLCARLHVPLVVESVCVPELAQKSQTGLEDTARKARYSFLEQERCRCKAEYILTAHHCGDLAEDILMRLLRGASWPALGGMDGYFQDRCLLRPLLMKEKQTLVDFIQHCAGCVADWPANPLDTSLLWVEDASNADCQYRRNRIRHTLLPAFLAENPNFYDQCRQLWSSSRRDGAFFTDALSPLLEKAAQSSQKISLPCQDLREFPAALRIRAYLQAIECLGGQARWQNLEKLDAAVLAKKSGAVLQFSGKIKAQVTAGALVFSRGSEQI